MASSAVLAHSLQLNLDLQQVREEREKGSKRESHSEERNEAHLDDCLVVEEDKCPWSFLHLLLLFDFSVHLEVLFLDHILVSVGVLTSNLCEPGIEEFVDFPELPLDLALEERVLKHVVTDLLKGHYCNDVHLQLLVVLVVENIDEVRDVQVDELEHVCLIDHRIL